MRVCLLLVHIKTPTGEAILGGEEYKDKPLNFVDQVGRFSEVGPGKKYSSIDQLPSKMSEGEENTGIRLVKVPIPEARPTFFISFIISHITFLEITSWCSL